MQVVGATPLAVLQHSLQDMDKALTFHCQLLRKLQPAMVSFGHVYLVAGVGTEALFEKALNFGELYI